MTPCAPLSWVIADLYSSMPKPPSAVIIRGGKTHYVLMGLLPGRMGHLFEPKARDYVHRAIVQAIVDAKAEAAGPCTSPAPKETPQDLIEMLTGYKQVSQVFPAMDSCHVNACLTCLSPSDCAATARAQCCV